MKKLVLVMALLLAVPAMAVVNFSGVVDPVAGTITLKYAGEPTELPRGFALKLSVTSGDAKINGWSGSSFFDVFIDYAYSAGAGYTKGAGHPFANPAAPGPMDVSAGVTLTSLCMGYLDEDGDETKGEPGAQTGDLIVLNYTNTTESVLTVEADTLRGPASGVVGSTLASNLPINITIGAVAPACASKFTGQMLLDYNAYVAAGKDPSCWCWKYQCEGDANNDTEGVLTKYRVSTTDLNRVLNNWKKKIDTADPCADIDHKAQGTLTKYRVSTDDLNKVLANWKKKDAQLTICPEYIP